MRSLWWLGLGAVVTLAACGGRFEGSDHFTDGSSGGGSSSGGSSSGGGGGGGGTCLAMPVCDAGHKQVASESGCLQDDGVCYSRSMCGTTIWCTGGDVCRGIPTCPPSYYEVKDCSPNSPCMPVTLCGKTILCQQPCEGVAPICNPGDWQVNGPGGCLADGVCYSRSNHCGYTIWCTGTGDTEPGLPPPPPK